MIRLRQRAIALVASVVMLCSAAVITTTAGPAGASSSGQTTCSNAFFDGDTRLGPAELPTAGPVYPIVAGYHRFGDLSEQQFLTTFWDPTARGGQGGWRYPPDNGFLLDRNGQPEEMPVALASGQQLDRFGSEFGSFLAPVNTPYASRALPPMSLDNFDISFTCNYHRYKVVKAFTVEAGPIAPGFAQRGLGRQYQVVNTLLPGDPPSANVMWLLGHGYLQRLATSNP